MDSWPDDITRDVPRPALQPIRTSSPNKSIAAFRHERCPMHAAVLGNSPALLRQAVQRLELDVAEVCR